MSNRDTFSEIPTLSLDLKSTGNLIMYILTTLKRPVKLEEIAERVAMKNKMSYEQVVDPVQTALRIGVRHGFIQNMKEFYYSLHDVAEILNDVDQAVMPFDNIEELTNTQNNGEDDANSGEHDVETNQGFDVAQDIVGAQGFHVEQNVDQDQAVEIDQEVDENQCVDFKNDNDADTMPHCEVVPNVEILNNVEPAESDIVAISCTSSVDSCGVVYINAINRQYIKAATKIMKAQVQNKPIQLEGQNSVEPAPGQTNLDMTTGKPNNDIEPCDQKSPDGRKKATPNPDERESEPESYSDMRLYGEYEQNLATRKRTQRKRRASNSRTRRVRRRTTRGGNYQMRLNNNFEAYNRPYTMQARPQRRTTRQPRTRRPLRRSASRRKRVKRTTRRR